MRAVLFFRMLNEGRKIHRRENALFMADMCEVFTSSFNFENYKITRKAFVEKAFTEPGKKPKRKALPLDDVRTAQIVGAQMQSLSKFMGRVN